MLSDKEFTRRLGEMEKERDKAEEPYQLAYCNALRKADLKLARWDKKIRNKYEKEINEAKRKYNGNRIVLAAERKYKRALGTLLAKRVAEKK